MSKKSSLGAAERTALVLQLLAKEEPAAQIARRAGVSETTLYRWREQFLEGGAARVAGNGTPQKEAREIERLRRAVAKRDQVIGELTIANRLLGKVQRDDIP
jgi:transposase